MEKKGKGKVAIIILLILAIIALGGYIYYNNNENQKNTDKLNKKISTLNSQVKKM